MLLHAGITEVVAESARKFPQLNWPVQFEGSATAVGAEQAQATTPSTCGYCSKLKAEPHTLHSVCSLNSLAVLYNRASSAVC